MPETAEINRHIRKVLAESVKRAEENLKRAEWLLDGASRREMSREYSDGTTRRQLLAKLRKQCAVAVEAHAKVSMLLKA